MTTPPHVASRPAPRPHVAPSRAARPAPLFEPLEGRRLLAGTPWATLAPDGLLAVVGSNSANVLTVGRTIDAAGDEVVVALRGRLRAEFAGADVRAVQIKAGGGDDVVTVSAGVPVVVAGGSGDDVIDASGTTAGATLYGHRGRDVITGGSGDDRLDGGSDDDVLTGGAGDDTLAGSTGGDRLDGGAGADVLDGGDGFDFADYTARLGDLAIDASDGLAADGEPGEGDRVGADVEGLLGGAGDDALTAGPSASLLFGGAGDDTLTGGAGDDTLAGGVGDDTMDGKAGGDGYWGQAGTDTVSYAGRARSVRVTVGSGTAAGAAADGEIADDASLTTGLGDLADAAVEGDDVQGDVEVVVGGDAGDRLAAGPSATRLEGGLGDDTLTGGLGDDTLAGGAGDDLLAGGDGTIRSNYYEGDGSDLFQGGGGSDTVTYAGRIANLYAEGVSVTVGAGAISGGSYYGIATVVSQEGDDVTADIEAVIGTDFRDDLRAANSALRVKLVGGGGDDRLYADGNDVIDGGAGNDLLYPDGGGNEALGGSGDDQIQARGWANTFDGGDGTDTVSYGGHSESLVIDLDGSRSGGTPGASPAGDPATRDAFVGRFEVVFAGPVDDTVYGSAFGETIYGTFGNDVLHDGGGIDVLFGGEGNDTFVVAADGQRDALYGDAGTDTYDRESTEPIAANNASNIEVTIA